MVDKMRYCTFKSSVAQHARPKEASLERQVLTVNEWCEATGMGRSTALRMIKSGALRAIKMVREFRIPRTEIDRFLSGEMTAGMAEQRKPFGR